MLFWIAETAHRWRWLDLLIRKCWIGFSAFPQMIYVCFENYGVVFPLLKNCPVYSIGDLHQNIYNTFPASISPNWKNLNHLFIHSPIKLELADQLLCCCCNLVARLLEIARGVGCGYALQLECLHHPSIFSPSYISISSRRSCRL